MTKTDIFSGFLGAGKTTLIRKLIAEAYKGEKLVLIENEFGDIAIDGAFLKDAGIEITEMNSGCICCTLVGDFRKALEQVVKEYAPDRIIIEPSGVGKLSDVAKAVEAVEDIEIGSKVTVVDAGKCKMYMRNFGEFFNDQVQNADLVVLSRTQTVDEAKTVAAIELLRTLNATCGLITTPWDAVSGEQIKAAMEENGLKRAMAELADEHHHDHHDYDDDDDEECECHHHHHDHDEEDEEEHEHHHHHHDDDDDDEEEHEHHHHHDHDDEDDEEEHEHHHHHHDHDDDDEDEHDHHQHHHDHDHHHHHHLADEIFDSFGMETPRKYTAEDVSAILDALHDEEKFGIVLRAKGFVDGKDGNWIYFDYVPEEKNIRGGEPAVTGRFCVIGSKLKEDALKELFNIG
ncbi:MAG: GTP-binding protein [Oscillospiraceae bacterium]|nr:GTP-binding protein [Oscillospiraceae bacterium]